MAASLSSDAWTRPDDRLAEDLMAMSGALTRLRADAQDLLRGPMNHSAARQLAMIRRSVATHHDRVNRLAAARRTGRTGRDNPVADFYVELTRARIADAVVYLDLAAKAIDQAAEPDPGGSAVGDAGGFDLRPGPGGARTPSELVAALRDYRVWAGEPSYRDMSERNNGRPAASTIYTALSSDELPKLDMVTAIVTGCGGGKEDRERFASAWRAIRTGAMTPSGPQAPELTPAQAAYGNLRQLAASRAPASPGSAAG
jgi:hypothetical protein